MPGKPKDQNEQETANTEQPTLTDHLNKYLLCAYLNRLNEEEPRGGGGDGESGGREENVDSTEETFTD